METKRLILNGIVIYILHVNRYLDIYSGATDGVLKKLSSSFDPLVVNYKNKYRRLILSRGVYNYIKNNEDIRKFIISREKNVNWSAVTENIVRIFTSVINQGDVGNELHKYNIVLKEKNNKKAYDLYTFIDNFIGQHTDLCPKDIVGLLLNSIHKGVFNYASVENVFMHIESKTDNKKYTFDELIERMARIKRILYFCYACHIFYELSDSTYIVERCQATSQPEDSKKVEPVKSSIESIPRISTLWLEESDLLKSQDAEYMVAKNIVLFGTYDLVIQCNYTIIEDILQRLAKMGSSYGVLTDPRDPTWLKKLLGFLYYNYLRVSDITKTIIYEFDILYSRYFFDKSKNLFRSYIDEKQMAEIMSTNITNYILDFDDKATTYLENSIAFSDSIRDSSMNGLEYFCTLINFFIDRYGYDLYDPFIEWLSKPYRLSSYGSVRYLHTYSIHHNGIMYDPLEFLIYVYDERTDVFTSYGLYILFNMLYRKWTINTTEGKKVGIKKLIPFLSII